MWRRLRVLVKKEFLQLFRDIPIVLILIWGFTGAIYVAGHAIDIEVNHYPIAVYDLDNSESSREFLARLKPPQFKIVRYLEDDGQIAQTLDKGQASLVVVIPPGFARDVSAHSFVGGGTSAGQAQLQVISDGTQSRTAMLAIAYIAMIVADFNTDLVHMLHGDMTVGLPASTLPQVNLRTRVAFNPNIDSAWFTSLLEMFNMITIVSMLLTAAALVREKLYNTLDQLMVTPTNPAELFLAKIVPALCVTLTLSMVSLFAVVHLIFDTPVRGNLVLFYLVSALYSFAVASLGMFIAVFARNIAQAMLILFMLLLPMLFLSGALTPPESMSPMMSYASLLSPMRYYMDFGYQVIFKGNGIAYVWPDVLGIVVFGACFFALSLARFKKMLA